MNAISDAILAIDHTGSPFFYNRPFALLFEAQMARSPLKHWHHWFAEPTLLGPEILEAFQKSLHTGQTTSVKPIPMTDPTCSSPRFFSLSVSPLTQSITGQSATRIDGAVGVFHDVTDLKRAEQIRIDFVANVSHELRTPLTAIKGYADTLLQDTQQGHPISAEFLEVIVRNADRLTTLMQDLLDLSSLESKDENQDPLQKMAIHPSELTSRVLQPMLPAFELKKQTLQLKMEASVVYADPRRLEQILVNLLDNAHKYTPSPGQIKVHWRAESDGTTLMVWNSGPGIPHEHHDRLFERFYRVDQARSREQGGTGLGLAIVKHIMQRHQGSVWVESQPGQGVSLLCRFPC
jgi:two-component system phosphate regulon sensor histidine kinase PhoR